MAALAAILADGPAGYWPLDEPAGATSVRDWGSAGVSGSLVGAPAFQNRAVPSGGNAPRLAKATPDWVSIPDNSAWSATANDVLTVECLVYLVSYSSTWSMVMTKANSSNYEWSLAITAAGLLRGETFNLASGSNVMSVVSSAAIPLGTWAHIAMTYNRNGLSASVFLNGVKAATTTSFSGDVSNGTSVVALGYRADSPGASSFATDGFIAHAAIFGKVLSDAQISRHAIACLTRQAASAGRARRRGRR